ncbi:MAG: alpha-L-fucosidase [Opitutales bacterium]|nr:alpha-L-fucosidase [Opitutales bacterium]
MTQPSDGMAPWFAEAKLGIFIHWGIYAVKGVPESWSFFRGQISHEDYMAQLDGFTAAKYDPEAWAKLFKRANARYAVLTTKHHDGVALWDTAQSDLSIPKRSPAARDVIAPWVEAMRDHDLRVGLYFSHLDWNHPDYPSMLPANYNPAEHHNRFAHPPDGQDHPDRWARFLKFHRAQLKELCERFAPDLFWFDGSWEPRWEVWKFAELRKELKRRVPGVILNARMGGHGDYETPEQGMPTIAPKGPWEFCMTLNDSWGYQPQDKNYKSPAQIIRMFTEVIGMGGNLLLDIGPKADGTIPAPQVRHLEKLGAWIDKHREAVFGTGAGLPPGLFYGSSTLSHDRRSLYLCFYDRPRKDIAVKGLHSPIKRVSIVGEGEPLEHRMIGGAPWAEIPGVLWIDVPARCLDRHATVVKVEFEEPLKIWLSAGHIVTAN